MAAQSKKIVSAFDILKGMVADEDDTVEEQKPVKAKRGLLALFWNQDSDDEDDDDELDFDDDDDLDFDDDDDDDLDLDDDDDDDDLDDEDDDDDLDTDDDEDSDSDDLHDADLPIESGLLSTSIHSSVRGDIETVQRMTNKALEAFRLGHCIPHQFRTNTSNFFNYHPMQNQQNDYH